MLLPAQYSAGGVYSKNSTLMFNGTTSFSSNSGQFLGGGIYGFETSALTPRRWHVSDRVGLLTLKSTEALVLTILGLLLINEICSGRSG